MYSEMHNKVLRRCCAVPYYLYCLRLCTLYHFILHSTIYLVLRTSVGFKNPTYGYVDYGAPYKAA